MSMRCKKCGEAFAQDRPFEVFEFRRHKLLPADSDGMVHTDTVEDGGSFCSRKCLGDYLASQDKSGVFNVAALRDKLKEQGKL
jgi:hypothetical protein